MAADILGKEDGKNLNQRLKLFGAGKMRAGTMEARWVQEKALPVVGLHSFW